MYTCGMHCVVRVIVIVVGSFHCNHCRSVQDYPVSEVLSGGYLFDTYDADLIQSVLSRLTPQASR